MKGNDAELGMFVFHCVGNGTSVTERKIPAQLKASLPVEASHVVLEPRLRSEQAGRSLTGRGAISHEMRSV